MLDLVIIGHVGFNQEVTRHGRRRSRGGAGYAVARGTTVVAPGRVGLISTVGTDFDVEALRKMGIETSGIRVTHGSSSRFHTTQYLDGSRSVDVDLGVGAEAPLSWFSEHHRRARHVHLCTAPPEQQLCWVGFLKNLPGRRTISCDAFEQYARTSPRLTYNVLTSCDLAFLNDDERRLIFADARPPGRAVVKHGSAGATYSDGVRDWHVPAQHVQAVDTTHAGEILAGVFLALTVAEVDPVTALGKAVKAASVKVTEFGIDGDHLGRALADIRRRTTAMRSGQSRPVQC